MQQTFYIDVDEEISSVIDRLRKSVAQVNYFVLPKRALFLQSIVNLKLLKREADKQKKQVIIVTSDSVSASLAEKAGFMVKNSIESESIKHTNESQSESEGVYEEEVDENESRQNENKKKRLNAIGSDGFYNAKKQTIKITKKDIRARKVGEKRTDKSVSAETRKMTSRDINLKQPQDNRHVSGGKNLDPKKEQRLEKMFTEQVRKQEEMAIPITKKTKKIFYSFIILSTLFLVGVFAYLFVPSAKIFVKLDSQKKKIDVAAVAQAGKQNDSANMIMALKVIEKQQQISLDFPVTGKSGGSEQKARGSVIIYNNYSSASQTLVSSTRLETSDGKIFRLTKNIVVPGTTTVAGEVKSGAIEAEVIADQAGQQYNIDPSEFTIPGFKDSPKYEKFSAKSLKPMTGGASTEGATPAVSEKDLITAKSKSEEEFKKQIIDSISQEKENGDVLLDQAVKITIDSNVTRNKIGESVDKVTYDIKGSALVLLFSETDAKDIVTAASLKEIDRNKFEDISFEPFDYSSAVADFDLRKLEIRIRTQAIANPKFDQEKFKLELLGKNESQLEDVLKRTPVIKNLNVEFSPSFVSRVPQYPSRVQIEVEKTQ